MSVFRGTTKIGAPVSPTSPLDVYPSHMALWGQGGFRSVQTLQDRDDLTIQRREVGMKVYIIEDDKEYRLVGGLDNINWKEVTFGSGDSGPSSSGDCPYRIMESLEEMEAIPESERTKGLTIYVKDVDQEYRLMKGIDNVNWTLISDPVLVNIGNSTTTGDGTIINNNEYITENHFTNSIGCLNKSLMLDSILGVLKPDFGIHKNDNGNIIVSVNDSNIFSFTIDKDTHWVDDMIPFKITVSIDPEKTNEVYMSIDEDGTPVIYNISELLRDGTKYTNLELHGNESSMIGYIKFNTYGQKNIMVWEEQDSVIISNLNKTLYIFAQNFAILDTGNPIPADLIETTGYRFTTKEYQVNIPVNSSYTISLAKVNVTNKGINTKNYKTIPGTSYLFNMNGRYIIDFAKIRTKFIDGNYALVLVGTENGTAVPTYFYGPFKIDLI